MIKILKKLANKEDGNIALTAALTFPVVVALSLGSLDYGTVLNKKQTLDDAANSAALSAVNEALISYQNLEDINLEELIEVTAQKNFEANTTHISYINSPDFSAEAEIDKNVLSVEVNYSAIYSTQFAKFAGKDTIPIAGSARASAAAESYMNFSFLFDVSASMGIGATSEDQLKVVQATGCAFACHINQSFGNSPYDRARRNGADMRIDVAKSSALKTLEIIKKNSTKPQHFTVGAHIFDNELFTISDHNDARSSDMTFVGSNITDGVYMQSQGGGTNIEYALSKMVEKLPDGGNGRSINDRRQIVVVLTDGIENSQSWYRGRGWRPHSEARPNSPFKRHAYHEINYALNTSVCDRLRSKDIEVFFIYTEYLKPQHGSFRSHDQRRFAFIESPLFETVPNRFAKCAGDPGRVYKSTTPKEIEDAFTRLLSQVTKPLHLN